MRHDCCPLATPERARTTTCTERLCMFVPSESRVKGWPRVVKIRNVSRTHVDKERTSNFDKVRALLPL